MNNKFFIAKVQYFLKKPGIPGAHAKNKTVKIGDGITDNMLIRVSAVGHFTFQLE
jgi:soluble P-type ATPase